MKMILALLFVAVVFVIAACAAPVTNTSTPAATPQSAITVTPTPCAIIGAPSGGTESAGMATIGPASRTTPAGPAAQVTFSPEMLATLEARVQRTGGSGPTLAPGSAALPPCPTATATPTK